MLDAITGGLGHGQTARQLRMRVGGASHHAQRDAEPDGELHGDVALGGLRTRLFEGRLDESQGGRAVAAIELDLGEELACEFELAAGASL